jgi:hypothetical protein
VAQGRAIGRFEAALGVVGVLTLATSYVLITGQNPGPAVLSWFDRLGALSSPPPAWETRLGGRPDYAVFTDRVLVVFSRGHVTVRDTRTGGEVWSRDVPWAAVAGVGSGQVVVVGRPNQKGFEALDPATQQVRWSDEQAVGVWTYRDLVLAITCPGMTGCTLAAHDPARGARLWRTEVPGVGKLLGGVNHELLGSRPLESTVDGRVNEPHDSPPMLGFPLDSRVQVIDLQSGKRVREAQADNTTRVVVVAGRLLFSHAERREGHCRYTLEARDPVTDSAVWRTEGYDLRTASGAGCEQRRDPMGGGNTLSAIRGDNLEVLLDAYDGREVWVGKPGEKVLATDGLVALIRSADGKSIIGWDIAGGVDLWQRPAHPSADAALTRYSALILDGRNGRVVAVETGTGRVLIDAKTPNQVIGVGPDGVLVAGGRTIGLVTNGSIAG